MFVCVFVCSFMMRDQYVSFSMIFIFYSSLTSLFAYLNEEYNAPDKKE